MFELATHPPWQQLPPEALQQLTHAVAAQAGRYHQLVWRTGCWQEDMPVQLLGSTRQRLQGAL
jgi:hypothetical protein